MKATMQPKLILTCLLVSALLLAQTSRAEVTNISAQGFLSEHHLDLAADPHTVFAALAHSIDKWWDASHSYSGDAAAFSLDLKPGGCFCEISDTGIAVEHMRVVRVIPDKLIVLRGALGPLQDQGVAGSMHFALTATDQGTHLTYRYSVGGYYPGGFKDISIGVDHVQLQQLKRLQAFVETP